MAKLVFDAMSAREFQTGVSHCVLFVKNANGSGYAKGVAWNGITTITESPEGAEETALYADNIKYLSLRSAEEFKASIEAYSSPAEFDVCDGQAVVGLGLKISQQTRRAFAICYKTKKGTAENPDLGEILHIIYGATASPSERSYATVNDSPEAMTLSWDMTCIPVEVEGYKPIYHLEIDLTKYLDSEGKLTAAAQGIIDSLYGTDAHTEGTEEIPGKDPELLMPAEIITALTPVTPDEDDDEQGE